MVKTRKVVSASLLGLALIPWLPWACQKRPRAPAGPPPPNYLELAEKYFETGDYANAVAAYNTYLRDHPSAPHQDRILFRLALAHSSPESPVRDVSQAIQLLQQLVSLFPQSAFRPQAELLLHQQEELERLRLDANQREERIRVLAEELERLKQGELQRLRSDVSKREERIRELTQELEKLKQIDMQRRPSPPPP